jgi:hypothetical protein
MTKHLPGNVAKALNVTIACFWLFAGTHRALAQGAASFHQLSYAPAPADNPLKGFFPFAGVYTNFPHSLEYAHFPLRALMTGPTNFNWGPLETSLNEIAQRGGHQVIFRIYVDYPAYPTAGL